MATNNPISSPLGQYNERALLAMILTEMRLLTELIAEEADTDFDLEARRLEIMNSNDIISGDAG